MQMQSYLSWMSSQMNTWNYWRRTDDIFIFWTHTTKASHFSDHLCRDQTKVKITWQQWSPPPTPKETEGLIAITKMVRSRIQTAAKFSVNSNEMTPLKQTAQKRSWWFCKNLDQRWRTTDQLRRMLFSSILSYLIKQISVTSHCIVPLSAPHIVWWTLLKTSV